LKCVMVDADISESIRMPFAFRVRLHDPDACLAVGPADGLLVFVEELEAEKFQDVIVKRARLLEIADADREMVDSGDAGHGGLTQTIPAGSLIHLLHLPAAPALDLLEIEVQFHSSACLQKSPE